MFERHFADVQHELDLAICKFPEWPTDPIHAAAIVAEECGELQRAVLQLTYEPHKTSRLEVMQEARQTAAMAIRFLASYGDYEFCKSEMVRQKGRATESA